MEWTIFQYDKTKQLTESQFLLADSPKIFGIVWKWCQIWALCYLMAKTFWYILRFNYDKFKDSQLFIIPTENEFLLCHKIFMFNKKPINTICIL